MPIQRTPSKNPRCTTVRGRQAEDAARHFLETQGLCFLERNYRARCGELDLVMRDGATVVFVETIPQALAFWRCDRQYKCPKTRPYHGHRRSLFATTPKIGESTLPFRCGRFYGTRCYR